ncbi:Uncharacterized protein HZ326_11717 [Fusarium oxysporum f. sp. albedinis]|nr:Uncharacterized protein HZ326_11717 [Fusarium oxysporum f. sp. albedinis]
MVSRFTKRRLFVAGAKFQIPHSSPLQPANHSHFLGLANPASAVICCLLPSTGSERCSGYVPDSLKVAVVILPLKI